MNTRLLPPGNPSSRPQGRAVPKRRGNPRPGAELLPVGKRKGRHQRKRETCCVITETRRRLRLLKMPDYLGADQRKTKEEEKDDKPIRGERTRTRPPTRERPALAPQRRRIPAASVPCRPWIQAVTALGRSPVCLSVCQSASRPPPYSRQALEASPGG